MSFVESSEINNLSCFLHNTPSADFRSYLKHTEIGPICYRYDNRNQIKVLSKVALQIFATPGSCCSFERHFSYVNNLVTSLQNRLGDDIIAELTFLRSAMVNFTLSDLLN